MGSVDVIPNLISLMTVLAASCCCCCLPLSQLTFGSTCRAGFGNGLRVSLDDLRALSCTLPLFGLAAMYSLRHPVTLGTSGRQVLGLGLFLSWLTWGYPIALACRAPIILRWCAPRRMLGHISSKFVRGSVNEMGRFTAAHSSLTALGVLLVSGTAV